jgi:hypothetical protein
MTRPPLALAAQLAERLVGGGQELVMILGRQLDIGGT